MASYPEHIGSRIRILRERYDLSVTELAQRATIDVSYLSRLERDALVGAKPKLDTIARVLDALGATADEREAVFHVEHDPLTEDEIQAAVTTVAHLMEDHPNMVGVTDDHWNLWYLNRSGRLASGYTPAEYVYLVGKNLLLGVIDPDSPYYRRVPEEQRVQVFSQLAGVFQILNAAREFDDWYVRLVSRIREFPWAEQAWRSGAKDRVPPVLDRLETTIVNPWLGEMRFVGQSNRLVSDARFHLVEYHPLDEETERKLRSLPAGGDLDYGWEVGL
jgi:transcriptional regulator with XRE-family HTH domain